MCPSSNIFSPLTERDREAMRKVMDGAQILISQVRTARHQVTALNIYWDFSSNFMCGNDVT